MTNREESSSDALCRTMLAESREELTRADAKASILLGSVGIFFSVIFAGMMSGPWTPSKMGAPYSTLFYVGIAVGIAGLVSLGWSIMPRVKNARRKGEVAYFGDVVSCADAAELHDCLEKTAACHSSSRSERQLHAVSRIVHRKYLWIRVSLVCLFVSVALSIGSTVVRYLL